MDILALDLNKYVFRHFYFLEPFANFLIPGGSYTKMIYTHKHFTIHGIYFNVPLEYTTDANKVCIQIDKSTANTKHVIAMMIQLEKDILHQFKLQKACSTKSPTLSIQKQLLSSKIRVYNLLNESNSLILLNITGVWENETEFGLNYKFIKAHGC